MKVIPVNDRRYTIKSLPSLSPKGKQPQVLLKVMVELNRPVTPVELTPLCEKEGLTAVGGVLPSVRYHLHRLSQQGIVEVVE